MFLAIYSTIINILIDVKTLYFVVLTNITSRLININRNIRLDIIIECINSVYIITDIKKFFTAMLLAVVAKPIVQLEPFFFSKKRSIRIEIRQSSNSFVNIELSWPERNFRREL